MYQLVDVKLKFLRLSIFTHKQFCVKYFKTWARGQEWEELFIFIMMTEHLGLNFFFVYCVTWHIIVTLIGLNTRRETEQEFWMKEMSLFFRHFLLKTNT